MDISREDAIICAFVALLDRIPSRKELDERVIAAGSDNLSLIYELIHSGEFLKRMAGRGPDIHLSIIHGARIKLIATRLPKADCIVDIGGANGNLYDLGYPYPFTDLTVVDLPDETRCEMYRGKKLEARNLSCGKLNVLYANATALDGIPDHSVDLVWMGQVIEHISEPESLQAYSEIERVLRPGGHFCLDTPNRLITRMQTDNWIHPEHKIEYEPDHLRGNLQRAGFRIESEIGICEMPNTVKGGAFDYEDFLTGSSLSSNLNDCYIQYFSCVAE